MTDLLGALRAIQAADPDGGPDEPSEADYARHRAWAIDTFGQQAWDRYTGTSWAECDTDEPRHIEY